MRANEVTRNFEEIEMSENGIAADELLPLVYDELRKLAAHRMAREAPGQTLQPTALVHEAWMRLAGPGQESKQQNWKSKGHFFGAAAEAMRRILIERARNKHAVKRGGEFERVEMREIEDPGSASDATLFSVHEALDALEREASAAAKLVKLRFFAGLTVDEAALALGVSDRTLRRQWRFARVWLYDKLSRELE